MIFYPNILIYKNVAQFTAIAFYLIITVLIHLSGHEGPFFIIILFNLVLTKLQDAFYSF